MEKTEVKCLNPKQRVMGETKKNKREERRRKEKKKKVAKEQRIRTRSCRARGKKMKKKVNCFPLREQETCINEFREKKRHTHTHTDSYGTVEAYVRCRVE